MIYILTEYIGEIFAIHTVSDLKVISNWEFNSICGFGGESRKSVFNLAPDTGKHFIADARLLQDLKYFCIKIHIKDSLYNRHLRIVLNTKRINLGSWPSQFHHF